METAVDFMFRKLVLECTFSTSEIIYKQAKIIEKEQLNKAYNSDRPNLCCYEENTAFKEYYKTTFNK